MVTQMEGFPVKGQQAVIRERGGHGQEAVPELMHEGILGGGGRGKGYSWRDRGQVTAILSTQRRQ